MNYKYTSTEGPSKYQQIYDHSKLFGLVPSGKTPHLDALEEAGLIEKLDIDDLAAIVLLMQRAYRNGQASTEAEKIDNDAVWINGVGSIERQQDGTWKLIMPDKSSAASILGSIKSDRKAKTSAANGRLGGRPHSLFK